MENIQQINDENDFILIFVLFPKNVLLFSRIALWFSRGAFFYLPRMVF